MLPQVPAVLRKVIWHVLILLWRLCSLCSMATGNNDFNDFNDFNACKCIETCQNMPDINFNFHEFRHFPLPGSSLRLLWPGTAEARAPLVGARQERLGSVREERPGNPQNLTGVNGWMGTSSEMGQQLHTTCCVKTPEFFGCTGGPQKRTLLAFGQWICPRKGTWRCGCPYSYV